MVRTSRRTPLSVYPTEQAVHYMEIMVDRMRAYLGDENGILVCPLGWGGASDFEVAERFLGETKYIRHALEQPLGLIDNEYRGVTTPASEVAEHAAEVAGMRDGKSLVIYDTSATRSGRSIMGGLIWGLDNSIELGVDHVFLAATVDHLGIVHFPGDLRSRTTDGPVPFIRDRMPRTYARLEDAGKLHLIGDYVPPKRVEMDNGDDLADLLESAAGTLSAQRDRKKRRR